MGDDMDGSLLSKIMKAEESLSAMERKGDGVDDLPDGHPVKVALRQSKEQYEQRQLQEKHKNELLRIAKKAKKVRDSKARKESDDRRQKEEDDGEVKMVVKKFNQRLDDIVDDMEKFSTGEIREFEDALHDFPRARASFDRIKRMFGAFCRGIVDSKIRANTIIQ